MERQIKDYARLFELIRQDNVSQIAALKLARPGAERRDAVAEQDFLRRAAISWARRDTPPGS